MKKQQFKIADEDMKCLLILWRWKLLSTSAIHHMTYSGRSAYGCYIRLLDLERKDFVISSSSWDQKTVVWHLGESGYKALLTTFSFQIENGFRSENKDHDFWVSAIHIGEWMTGNPFKCELFSEQELRRVSFADYPNWVPQTKEHRPDGWWKVGVGKPNSESLIALEVEFSKKSPQVYSDIGSFYSNTIDVCQVVWVVKTKTVVSYILEHLKKGSSSQAKEHSFILFDEYLASQWQTKIHAGKHREKTLLEILNSPLQNEGKPLCASFAMDVRKYPIKSRVPKLAAKAELGLSRQY